MMIGVIQAAARARIPIVKIHLAMCLSCQRVSAHWNQKYPLDSVAIRNINASPHQTFRYLETFIFPSARQRESLFFQRSTSPVEVDETRCETLSICSTGVQWHLEWHHYSTPVV
ncbi:hypothetical protein BJ912DRAFT_976617 [Pholiota molesta]|nr:hypothetical protein BJ912DRAFT_976617 [Pholiota molesta]